MQILPNLISLSLLLACMQTLHVGFLLKKVSNGKLESALNHNKKVANLLISNSRQKHWETFKCQSGRALSLCNSNCETKRNITLTVLNFHCIWSVWVLWTSSGGNCLPFRLVYSICRPCNESWNDAATWTFDFKPKKSCCNHSYLIPVTWLEHPPLTPTPSHQPHSTPPTHPLILLFCDFHFHL